MKQNCLIVLSLVAATLADIGEKLRLGQSIKPVSHNFNVGLQATFSTNQNTVSLPRVTNPAHHHDHGDDENNLERLCNDPFHSFLCEPVGPRKLIINGQLRPGARVPSNVFAGASSNQNETKQKPFRTGGALLAARIQPAPSFDSPRVLASNNNEYLPPQQSQPTQQFITSKANPAARPSNEYLPSNALPIPARKDNVQFTLPLQQPQQNVYRYTPIPPKPTFISPSTKSNFGPLARFPISTTPAPIRQTSPIFTTTFRPPTTTVRPLLARPSNQYLPVVEPIDIRINPSSTNLSPLIEGTSLLAATINPAKLNQPRKQERQHTLEELCNDAFHSFLCKPITKPRKRIDGRIRPGAKIPPHVLQGADTLGTSTRKLAPQREGTELLALHREEQNKPQGYLYPKPQINPFLDTQATNQQSVQNALLKDNLPPIPNRILPHSVATSNKYSIPNNQFSVQQTTTRPFTTTQRPKQNFQFQTAVPTQTVKPQPIPTVFNDNLPPIPPRIRPSSAAINPNQFPINQFKVQQISPFQKPAQNFQNPFSALSQPITTTLRPIIFNSQFSTISTTSQPPSQYFQVNQFQQKPNSQIGTQFGNYVFSKPIFPQNPIVASAQISTQSQAYNGVNQNPDGYQYSKPSTPFPYPTPTTTTTTKPPTGTLNLLYIPAAQNLQTSQNQIISTTTQSPASTLKIASATANYNYPKPSIAFNLPTPTTRRYEAPTVTPPQPTAIPSNNQPVTASKTLFQNQATGYQYPKPVKPFTLPTVTTPKSPVVGYTYPRPAKAFTLPPRNNLANTQIFGARISTPLRTINEFIATVNNNENSGTISDIALPPANQFEILKP